ncbi:S49 family peptidase [Afipia broomeae]|uniref:Signal peptide peptidase SppA, 36K type n=1 Tax=Afipia broomeae ATCC 49717 TaxID=883078 RepID=K8P0T7_9BRAD|nr:S49 family peptidase [Afipia broomeae]EKS34344.1 signal peptide peptidase SppA, 36K type [Afipia broomeae ATCC 49717]
MSQLLHIADRVLNRPLMILPDKLALIAGVLDGRIGIDATELAGDQSVSPGLRKPSREASQFVGEHVADPKDQRTRKPYRTTPEGVAVIPVLGSLVNRGGWIGSYSGMTSYEGLKHQISAAARDGDVRSIILDMDTPGGEAVGAFEVADVVKAAAASKAVYAVVNGMAASAGYAIASAATKIITTSSGISGSIGVVMLHTDHSGRLQRAGIVPTLIFAGARKVDGNPYEKLTSEVKAELKAEIDRFYDLFVASVAKGRKSMTVESIRATEARTFIGADAVAIGLADAVGSFESALEEIPKKELAPPKPALVYSQADLDRLTAAAHAKGRAEGESTAISDGGLKAAQGRIKQILALPEAQGRQKVALALAVSTSVDPEEAAGLLKGFETEAQQLRAVNSEIGLVVTKPRSA